MHITWFNILTYLYIIYNIKLYMYKTQLNLKILKASFSKSSWVVWFLKTLGKTPYLHIICFVWIHWVLIFPWIQRKGIFKKFNFGQLKISCTGYMNLNKQNVRQPTTCATIIYSMTLPITSWFTERLRARK